MKKIILFIAWFFIHLGAYAQHIYQIRADSVRIFNICDTAELIIENRTQNIRGFLYNKGGGRTEFRQLQLVAVGDSAIAIPGQDTLSLRAMLWSGVMKRGLVIAPDADYTIPNDVGVVILREVAAGRKIVLPPANTNMNREIVILDKTTGSNRWKVDGGYVPRSAKGVPPYDTVQNAVLVKGEKLILFSDGEKWYDLNVCGAGGNKSPYVNAGNDTALNQGTTSTTVKAIVTPGTSSSYTVDWEIVSKPAGSNPVISDTAALSPTITGLTGGSYVIKVTVTDANGLIAVDYITVTVLQPAQMFSSGGYNNNVYDTSTGRKTWMYLPAGYNPHKKEGYPLIIYLVGAGHSGTDINMLVNADAGLSRYLHQNAFPMESVVVTPQLTTGWWTTVEIKKAYDYATQHYNIDLDRVYITGFSSGGSGSCDAVAKYPELFAGYMPASSVENQLKYNGPAGKNVAGYFLHDLRDMYVDPNNSFTAVNSVNASSPKGYYPPIVKATRLEMHSGLWDRELYDKRIAPLDFEKDFLLLHNRNPLKTAANYVARAENSTDYIQVAIAAKLLDKLPASAEKSALRQRLDVKLATLTATQRFFVVDLAHPANAPAANTTQITSAAPGTIKHGLTDVTGSNYPISFEVTASAATQPLNDGLENDYLGFQHTVYKDGFEISGTGSTFVFANLSPHSRFNIRVFHARKAPPQAPKYDFSITANGVTQPSGENAWNTDQYAELGNIAADANGKITLQLTPLNGNAALVNAIMLIEKTAPQTTGLKAQFDFGITPSNIPGWTSVYGNPVQQVREFTDAQTGWMISTVSTANWKLFDNRYGSDTNGVRTGTFGEFPMEVVKSYFMHYWDKFNGTNYNLEIKRPHGQGLPAGTYRIKILGSIRKERVDLVDSDVNVRFGNGGNIFVKDYPTDNGNKAIILTGQVQEGGTIKIGIHASQRSWPELAFINGLIVEKID
ncbi:PKD domain-containing protein [Chitinophaga caseinilytica]|uniref:PKD domain-containing protein n=1 Tax=Chitinophaga caseinilytica TaxID=2267521 RepID=UPI003C2F3621